MITLCMMIGLKARGTEGCITLYYIFVLYNYVLKIKCGNRSSEILQ